MISWVLKFSDFFIPSLVSSSVARSNLSDGILIVRL